MNDRVKKSLMVIVVMAIAVLGTIILNYKVEKSYSTDSNIVSIQEFVDENDNPTRVSFVLENINILTMQNMSENKYKITSNDIALTFTNSQTNDAIDAENNIVTLSSEGVTVTADGISKGAKYDISIEPVETKYGYASEYKKATVVIDYTDKLNAYIKEVLDENNNSVEIDNKAILLYTEENNTVKLRANEDVDVEYTFSLTPLSDEELKRVDFSAYNKNNYLAVTTNGYLYAKAKYKTNGYSQINMLHITNIDKLLPFIDNTSVTLNDDNETATVNYTFDDTAETLEYGKSGVVKYAFSPSNIISDDKYIDVTPGQTSASSVVDENGTYYIHVKDGAGNKAVKEVVVNIIPEKPEEYVLVILESPNENLTGMLFTSLKKMTNKIAEFGLTKDDKVLAQVLTNIRNQETTIDNMDLTIDLNGYSIISRNNTNIFEVNDNSHLKFVDYKYTISDYIEAESWNGVPYSQFVNGTDAGSVISNVTNAVDIKQGGTLTLGDDNSPDLLHIEYPDHTSPYLMGADQAVLNNGTFNYYDGVLVGNIALNGEVQDTPYLHDPSVVFNDELEKHYMTLEKVTNIEALIGKTRFTLLEDAVDYANKRIGDSNTPIEIDIVAELDKAITIEVDNTKNIILDLNSHTFSNHITAPILNNYGRLVIKDTGEEGIIVNPNQTVINNYPNAYLQVDGGTLQCNASNYNYRTINNDKGAEVVLNNGTVNQNYRSGYAVYNNGGKVTVNDGLINTSGTSIYNNDVIDNNDYDSEESIDLSTIKYNYDNYPFVMKDGSLSSSNYGNRYSSTAGYYEIDLTDYSKSDKFVVEATVSVGGGYRNYAWAYGTVKTDVANPGLDDTMYLFSKTYSYVDHGTYRYTITGGQKWYAHFGYIIRGTSSDSTYRLDIHSVKLNKLHTYIGELHINGGTINGLVSNNGRYKSVYVAGGDVNGELKNPYGSVVMTGGNLYGGATHGASQEDCGNNTFDISGGYVADITNVSSSFGNTINISGGVVRNIKNGGASGTNSSKSYLNVTGGEITGTITNGAYMNLDGAYITGQVIHKGQMDTEIKNTVFEKKPTANDSMFSLNVDTDPGDLYGVTRQTVLTNCEFKLNTDTFGTGTPYYSAIINNATGNLVINNSEINANINDINTNRGTWRDIVLIGVENTSKNANVYLVDSNITTTTSTPDNLLAIGVHNTFKGKFNIGNKDGDYKNDTCIITSSYIPVSNVSYAVNFYDGILKGKSGVIGTPIEKIEDGYYIYEHNDGEYNIIELNKVSKNNILNVEKNKYYSTINEAILDSSENNTIKVIENNLYEPLFTVDSGKKVTIDFNNKNIKLGGIINNGDITVVDTVDGTTIQSNTIINNNVLNITGGNFVFSIENVSSIVNNGLLSISNTTMNTNTTAFGAIYNQGYDGELISNNNTLNIQSGAKLYTNTSYEMIINNHYTGTVNMSGGEMYLDRPNRSGVKGIYNSGVVNMTGGQSVNGYGYGIVNTAEYVGPDAFSEEGINKYDVMTYVENGTIRSNISRIVIPIDLTGKTGKYTFEFDRLDTNGGTTVGVDTSSGTQNVTVNDATNPGRRVSTIKYDAGSIYYIHLGLSYHNLYDIKVYNEDKSDVIELMKHGTVNMSGGEITNFLNYNSTANITGGTVKNGNDNYTYALHGEPYSEINISGGTFNSSSTAVYVNKGSNLHVAGGTITNVNTGIYGEISSNIVIDDVTITNATTGIEKVGVGDYKFNNGNIDLSNANGYLKGAAVGLNATFEMNGGTIKVSSDNDRANPSYAVSSTGNNTNINIYDGTIIARGVNKNLTFYGIFGTGDTATNVQLGKLDEDVSITSPSITGTSHGIYKKNGDFKFYDGIIKGDTTFYGGVTDRPEGYELFYGTEDTLNTVILKKVELIENIDTGAIYSTFQSAVNKCVDNEVCNLKVLYPFTQSGIGTIYENKIINLDLNDLNVTTLADNYFKNYGTLSISNGSMDIQSGSSYESIIQNYGILNLEDGATINANNFNKIRAIYNHYNATFNMNGGTIIGSGAATDEFGTGLYNNGGTVNLRGGEIIDNSGGGAHSIICNTTRFVGNYYTLASGFTLQNEVYGSIAGPTKGTSSFATYYVPIDLTNVEGEVTLEVGFVGTVVNPSSSNTTYLKVSETVDFTNLAKTADASGSQNRNPRMMRKKLTGGKMYYLLVSSGYYGRVNSIRYYNDNVDYNYFQGTMNIDGTNIISNNANYSVYTYGGTLNYNSGEIKSATAHNGYGIYATAGAKVNINNGTITDKQYGVYMYDIAATLNVNGLTFTNSANPSSTYGIYLYGGNHKIKNFNMTINDTAGYIYGVYANSDVNTTIDNSNIIINGTNSRYYALYLNNANNIGIKDSQLKVKSTNAGALDLFGIYMGQSNNSVDINSSTISAEGSNSNNSIYGIYGVISLNANNETAYFNNITIGNPDDPYDSENTLIYGTNSGIVKRYGDLKFYDGTIKGHTVYPHGINDFTSGYLPTVISDSGEEKLILQQRNIVVNKDTNTQYSTFNDAFNACVDNTECNLKVLETNYITGISTVPKNKIVNLDFDGKTIHDSKDTYFVNNGTLTLTNGTLDVIGTNFGSNPTWLQGLIVNNGTLNISTGMNINSNDYKQCVLIINNWTGVLNVNDGNLSATYDAQVILNEGGEVNINGGNLKAKGRIIMTQGNIKAKHTVYSGQDLNYFALGYLGVDRREYKYYIPIDLTDYSGNVKVTPVFDNGTYSAGSTVYYNYIALTESTDEPNWIELNDYSTTRYDFEVQGGKVYYLHVHNTWYFLLKDILIDNGEVEHMMSRGTVNVNGGTITDGAAGVYSANSDVYFKGGNVIATSTTNIGIAFDINNESKIYVSNGGKISDRAAIDIDKSYGRIDGVQLINCPQGINSTNGIIDVYNYDYDFDYETAMNPARPATGISFTGTRGATIYNADIDIHVNSAAQVYGINASGTGTIKNATINVKNDGTGIAGGYLSSSGTQHIEDINAVASGNKAYGLYISSGEVIQGDHDGTMPSTTNPHFTGDTYGAYITYGKLRFFDGRFTSSNLPMYGNVEEIPVDYRIVAQGNSYILNLKSAIEDTFELNGIYYQSIDMPVSVIAQSSTKKGTINIWNSATLSQSVTIPSGTNITLALQGHTIDFDNVQTGIVNNGTLTVIDGNQDEIDSDTMSHIINESGTTIQNSGTLVIGVSNNKNPNSPEISGSTAVSGNSPTINSGKVVSTSNTLGASPSNILSNLFTPSYSYKYNDLEVNNLPSNTVLAEMPGIRSVDDLTVWTNQDINVGMTSHNLSVLNLFTTKDNNCKKDVKYTVHVYKNGILDEFNSFDHVVSKYCLDDDIVTVDLDYFEKVPTQFKGFYITRVVLNDNNITTIPPTVYNNSVFDLYYGQSKGEEVIIVNPKTGRRSYITTFIILSIITICIIIISIIYYRNKNKAIN